MNILLDTHILLWHLTDNSKLPKIKSDIIENIENKIFFSIASLWEIGIKKSIGKLEIHKPLHCLVPDNILILNLYTSHIENFTELPFYHRDPFDRIIIAQSIVEDLFIMTDDMNFKHYNVKII